MAPSVGKTNDQIKDLFIICDLNVFVMAFIFNDKLMLDSEYTFGKLYIHQEVYTELQRWKKSKAKIDKFGLYKLGEFEKKCSAMIAEEINWADLELENKLRRIDHVESKLSQKEKSNDTSKEDKLYIATAVKLKACLATQEKTMRSIGLQILGEKRITSFEEMVVDLFQAGKLTQEQLKSGLENLKKYKETLSSDRSNLVEKLLQ